LKLTIDLCAFVAKLAFHLRFRDLQSLCPLFAADFFSQPGKLEIPLIRLIL
jgi:hypothetical protein